MAPARPAGLCLHRNGRARRGMHGASRVGRCASVGLALGCFQGLFCAAKGNPLFSAPEQGVGRRQLREVASLATLLGVSLEEAQRTSHKVVVFAMQRCVGRFGKSDTRDRVC